VRLERTYTFFLYHHYKKTHLNLWQFPSMPEWQWLGLELTEPGLAPLAIAASPPLRPAVPLPLRRRGVPARAEKHSPRRAWHSQRRCAARASLRCWKRRCGLHVHYCHCRCHWYWYPLRGSAARESGRGAGCSPEQSGQRRGLSTEKKSSTR